MENSEYTLNMLGEGDQGKVVRLKTRGDMRRRLQDIGLIEGTLVKCVLKSPSGDPAAYFIRGAVIALRDETASEIVL